MSSTTDPGRFGRRAESGQALVLFTLALVCLIGLTAMVFDVGQTLVDRRAQQDAADAAALAGAAHLPEPACRAAPSVGTCATAVAAALDVAEQNGYVDGVGGVDVDVLVPPGAETSFGGLANHIQVVIQRRSPSFFQGLLGIAMRDPRALAVAANNPGISLPYSFIALNPTACGINKVNGNGSIVLEAGVQVDSNCPTNALLVSGKGAMTVPTCNVVGGFQESGGGAANCEKPPGVMPLGDPLRDLPPPPVPPSPAPVQVLSGGDPIPNGCPGSAAPATMAAPKLCTFSKSGTYRIFPGLYPGGLKFNQGTIYMEPGLYYLAGGGFTKSGGGTEPPTVISVDPGGTTFGGGVMLFNTCPTGTTGECAGPIQANGASGSTVQLRAIQSTLYRGILVYQDRAVTTTGASVVLNGNAEDVALVGSVYVPSGEVQVNGNGTGMTVQVIADTFKINGSGALMVGHDDDAFVNFRGVGLVQ